MKTLKWRTFIAAQMLDSVLHGNKIVTAYAVNQKIVVSANKPDTKHPCYLCHATRAELLPWVRLQIHITLSRTVSRALFNKDLPENPPRFQGDSKS